MTQVKVKCMICKVEEQVTNEEITVMNRFIEKNPKAKAIDYCRLLAISRGPVCTGEKEHRFMMHPDFGAAVDESVLNVDKCKDEFDKFNSKDEELRIKLEATYKEMRRLAHERADVIEGKNAASDSLLASKKNFAEIAGSDMIRLWR